MLEIELLAGDHIQGACERLAAAAPAFMIFNDIRVEAKGGESAADLYAAWSAEMHRRHQQYLSSPERKKHEAESEARKQREASVRKESIALVARSGVREKYKWSDGMGGISGFGGGYESACRDMLYAGLAWLDANPRADSDSVKTGVDKAILAACPDCSGAMHGAVMSACKYIRNKGWPAYCEIMSRQPAKDAE